jgi:hypothetical protein
MPKAKTRKGTEGGTIVSVAGQIGRRFLTEDLRSEVLQGNVAWNFDTAGC